MKGPLTRRQTLFGLAGLSVSLTGCASPASESEPTDDEPEGKGDSEPTDGTGTNRGNGGSTTTDVPPGERTLGAEVVASGLPAPLAVAEPVPGRIFVADQRGRIFVVAGGSPQTYLDIRDRLADDLKSEMGLIGVAFHPDFADNGKFYVRYSASPRPGTPVDFNHTFVLSEFEAEPGADTADPSTERTLLEIPEPQANHNCGNLVFGPEGHLYVGVGDGGWAGDQGPGHVQDWYGAVGGGNGQDVTENLLGSILRIDVDERAGGLPYGIPDDNPLVGEEGFDEHFAWGLRNPWGMSFGPEGRFFVADVGQSTWEEVNVVQRGGNYGWNVREGTHCYDRDDCPSVTPDGQRLRPPIIEYPHSGGGVSGSAVVGGYLYDGSRLPAFRGDYVFGDFQAGTEVFVATEVESGPWPTYAVDVDHPEFGPRMTGIGRDADGEILVCCVGNGGTVLRLTGA